MRVPCESLPPLFLRFTGTLQHTATHCNTKIPCAMRITFRNPSRVHTAIHCNTRKRTKTYCNTLRNAARHSNTLQDTQHIDMCTMRTAIRTPFRIQTATNCNILHPIQERVCPRCSTCMCAWMEKFGERTLVCVVEYCSALQCVAVCCSVLQSVAVCCSLLQCVAMRCYSVLFQCVSDCCSILQYNAVCVEACCRDTNCSSENRYKIYTHIYTFIYIHVHTFIYTYV